jgi:hypothetical protein
MEAQDIILPLILVASVCGLSLAVLVATVGLYVLQRRSRPPRAKQD